MAAFSYNFYSGDSYLNQYRKYLQNQNYVNQIDEAIRETGKMNAAVIEIQAQEVYNAINVSSEKQREAIIQAADSICSSLESGFWDLNNSLEDIKDGIHGLSNLVGHGFSIVAEGQKITHKYLGKIQNLLRIPDSQKQRVYHIDEGMKYLQNAFRQTATSDFYTDALEEFQKSEAIEKKDFFSLFHIGLIYLKSDKHLNPKISESYFKSSARYYLAEALVSGTNASNNLLQSHKGFLLEAAEAYLFAAEACYIQQKFSEAAELAAMGWKTFPDMTKAGFLQAKYLAANNQPNEAASILEKAIRINRFLSMEVLPDLDLNSKPAIINLLEKLRVEALQEAKAKYQLCYKTILLNSAATSYLSSVDKLIKFATFLEAKEADDLLLASCKWTISSGAHFNAEGQVIGKISSHEFTGSVIDFVKFERERVLALPRANDLIRIEEIERQKSGIQTEIGNLQAQVQSKNSELEQKWKMWGGGFLIWIIAVAIGIGIGDAHGFLEVLLVLACGLVMYIGGAILVVTLVIFIVNSVQIGDEVSSLKSEIQSRQQLIEEFDIEIRKLQRRRLKNSR
jgi:predicted RNA-binding protein with RPS1 domain